MASIRTDRQRGRTSVKAVLNRCRLEANRKDTDHAREEDKRRNKYLLDSQSLCARTDSIVQSRPRPQARL